MPASMARQRLAVAARLAVLEVLAVERLGEDAGGRGLARAPGPAEQVGVADPPLAHGVAQRGDDVVLAPHLAEPAAAGSGGRGTGRPSGRAYRSIPAAPGGADREANPQVIEVHTSVGDVWIGDTEPPRGRLTRQENALHCANHVHIKGFAPVAVGRFAAHPPRRHARRPRLVARRHDGHGSGPPGDEPVHPRRRRGRWRRRRGLDRPDTTAHDRAASAHDDDAATPDDHTRAADDHTGCWDRPAPPDAEPRPCRRQRRRLRGPSAEPTGRSPVPRATSRLATSTPRPRSAGRSRTRSLTTPSPPTRRATTSTRVASRHDRRTAARSSSCVPTSDSTTRPSPPCRRSRRRPSRPTSHRPSS